MVKRVKYLKGTRLKPILIRRFNYLKPGAFQARVGQTSYIQLANCHPTSWRADQQRRERAAHMRQAHSTPGFVDVEGPRLRVELSFQAPTRISVDSRRV